jgi:predicted RNase H-like HicB family nuclease
MLDASYYSVIERGEDGRFFAWVPDLPGIRVTGQTEAQVIRALSQQIRQCVRDKILSGAPVPAARSADQLPPVGGRIRRLLLIVG